jgi:recombination protein RecA
LEIITKRGAFYSYGDIRLGQGRENAKEFLRQNQDLMDEIDSAVREHAMQGFAIGVISESEENFSDEEA